MMVSAVVAKVTRKGWALFETTETVFVGLGSALGLVLFVIVLINTLFRISGTGILIATESVGGYILVWTIFLLLPNSLKLERHVKVDLLTRQLPLSVSRSLAIVTDVLILAIIVVLTGYTFVFMIDSYTIGARPAGMLSTPLWIVQLIIPIGLGLASLRLAVKIRLSFAKACRV